MISVFYNYLRGRSSLFPLILYKHVMLPAFIFPCKHATDISQSFVSFSSLISVSSRDHYHRVGMLRVNQRLRSRTIIPSSQYQTYTIFYHYFPACGQNVNFASGQHASLRFCWEAIFCFVFLPADIHVWREVEARLLTMLMVGILGRVRGCVFSLPGWSLGNPCLDGACVNLTRMEHV